MMELLSELSETPVPNVLVIAGIVFLLLAVAGKIGAYLSVPPHRQKIAALIGAILLISGIAIFMAPRQESSTHPQDDRESLNDESKRQQLNQESKINHSIEKASIEQALMNAARQEAKAVRYLDPTALDIYYAGEILRGMLGTIDLLKRNGEFLACKMLGRQYHNIDIKLRGRQAVIDLTENWNCAAYSVEDGNCLRQYPSIHSERQTVFMELRASGWLVTTIKHAETSETEEWTQCTESWPANIKF